MKLVLAAAMWNNPHLLIMDEPTNYLDRVSRVLGMRLRMSMRAGPCLSWRGPASSVLRQMVA